MKKWKTAAIVSGAVVGIVGIVGSVFAFLNHKKPKDEPDGQEPDLEQTVTEKAPEEETEEISEQSNPAQ